jgi:hypothetical protein
MFANRLLAFSFAAALALAALPAAASHRPTRESSLARLAHELERASEALVRDAARGRHERGFGEWRALSALGGLERSASAFRAVVAREGVRDRDTRRAFERLGFALAAARDRLDAVRARRSLRRDFARAEALFGELELRLAGHDRDGRRYGRSARAAIGGLRPR